MGSGSDGRTAPTPRSRVGLPLASGFLRLLRQECNSVCGPPVQAIDERECMISRRRYNRDVNLRRAIACQEEITTLPERAQPGSRPETAGGRVPPPPQGRTEATSGSQARRTGLRRWLRPTATALAGKVHRRNPLHRTPPLPARPIANGATSRFPGDCEAKCAHDIRPPAVCIRTDKMDRFTGAAVEPGQCR